MMSIHFPETLSPQQVYGGIGGHPQMVGPRCSGPQSYSTTRDGSTTSVDMSDERPSLQIPSWTALESPCIAVTMASMHISCMWCDHFTTSYFCKLRMSSGSISGQAKSSTAMGIMFSWFCIAVTISCKPSTISIRTT